MAAKAKAPAKGRKGPVKAVKTKVKAKPRGLQLSAAQFKAYTKAYSATASAAYRRRALAQSANRFRKYRLAAAYATVRQANAATARARTAAIASFAARTSLRQSHLAHQNAALSNRIAQNAYRHGTISGRMQYAQSGVKAYAHAAVMRTVTTGQARTHAQAVFAAASRAAKAGRKSVRPKGKRGKPTAAGAAINRQAAAAGLRAARAVKGSSKAAKGKVRPVKQKAAQARAKATGKKAAQSKKAPVVKAKSRTAPYKGVLPATTFDGNGHWILGLNEFEGTCIMTAVANALYRQTRWRLPDEDIAYWTGRAGPEPTIGGVLKMLYRLQPWPQVRMHEPIELVPEGEYFMDRIIGFDDHAAYAFRHRMVSYAELLPVADNTEEVWTCEFRDR